MKERLRPLGRREFLKKGGAAALFLPVLGLSSCATASLGAESPQSDEEAYQKAQKLELYGQLIGDLRGELATYVTPEVIDRKNFNHKNPPFTLRLDTTFAVNNLVKAGKDFTMRYSINGKSASIKFALKYDKNKELVQTTIDSLAWGQDFENYYKKIKVEDYAEILGYLPQTPSGIMAGYRAISKQDIPEVTDKFFNLPKDLEWEETRIADVKETPVWLPVGMIGMKAKKELSNGDQFEVQTYINGATILQVDRKI